MKAVNNPKYPPAVPTCAVVVNLDAPRSKKVMVKKAKTLERAIDERSDAMNMMKVKMNHPKR